MILINQPVGANPLTTALEIRAFLKIECARRTNKSVWPERGWIGALRTANHIGSIVGVVARGYAILKGRRLETTVRAGIKGERVLARASTINVVLVEL